MHSIVFFIDQNSLAGLNQNFSEIYLNIVATFCENYKSIQFLIMKLLDPKVNKPYFVESSSKNAAALTSNSFESITSL